MYKNKTYILFLKILYYIAKLYKNFFQKIFSKKDNKDKKDKKGRGVLLGE